MLSKIFNIETLNQVGRYLVGETEQSRMSAWQKTPQQIQVSIPKGKPFVDETNKIPPDKKVETEPVVMIKQETDSEKSAFSLQEAIIWSEILGKPMCKRRTDRNRFR